MASSAEGAGSMIIRRIDYVLSNNNLAQYGSTRQHFRDTAETLQEIESKGISRDRGNSVPEHESGILKMIQDGTYPWLREDR
jgi:hypothetical protein